MSDDYLWDQSGPPDAEIAGLEQTLASLRYRPASGIESRLPRQRRGRRVALAAAAAVIAAAYLLVSAPPATRSSSWQVASLQGAASMGGRRVEVAASLGAGQLLRTAEESKLSLESDEIGKIDLGPDSELRASSGHKVLLQRGQLHAFIWAPPREFVVDTPSARAVDLGCEYTLNVNASGDGILHVEMGWVAFQYDDHESFIPAGAECVTRKRKGPGVPFYGDASTEFRKSLSEWESGQGTALPRILTAARPKDALSLWHLLTRVPQAQRGEVFDRFAHLVSLPPEVSRESVLRTDRQALDRCWDALNLENTGWWRGWERVWK